MFDYQLARRSQTVELFNSSTAASNSIFQVEVANPYDWLEDSSSHETREFVASQNAALDNYLSTSTSSSTIKTKLMASLQSLVQGEVVSQTPQSAGEYYLVRVSGRGRAFPVTIKIRKDDLRAFLQPSVAELSAKKSPQVFHDEGEDGDSLLASGVSKGGQYWAYCTSVKGSDWGVIRVKETKTGKLFLDEIRDTKFNNITKPITWWGDLGFFYQYWHCSGQPNARPQLRYHTLGTSQGDDKVIYEETQLTGRCFWLDVSDDGKFAFLSIYGAGQTCQVRAWRLRNWNNQPELDTDIPICDTFDYKWESIGQVSRQGQQLYAFWTDRNNGEVVGFALDNPTPFCVVLISGVDTQTLKIARAIGDEYILAIRSVDVCDRLQLKSIAHGKITTIDSPIDTVFGVSFDPKFQDIFIIESSFSRPFSLWHIHGKGLALSLTDAVLPRPVRVKLYPEHNTNTAGVSHKQIFFSSADGTKVPMFLVSDNSNPITPDTPVLLYVYGAFGISVIPHFRPDFSVFIKSFRGIVAFANIRGGGEYGRQWHLDACKEKRQHLLDDIHGALEYLINTLGVTRKPILMGESMGALNSISAIVQHPNLVSAAILNAGPFDVLRRGKLGLGMRGVEDIGNEQIPHEFAAIFRWSPLENIRQGYPYPPTLFTAGDQDDLVTYTHSCKMAATLQYVQQKVEGNSAVHLRISKNLGHGGAVSAMKQASISVERWLWLKTTLGLEIYE